MSRLMRSIGDFAKSGQQPHQQLYADGQRGHDDGTKPADIEKLGDKRYDIFAGALSRAALLVEIIAVPPVN